MANCIEFMVVATGTGDGQSEKGFCDRINLIVREANMFIECIGGCKPVKNKSKI